MTEWLLLALSVVLIAICGVFVAGEFALLAADRPTVQGQAERGDRRAQGVRKAFRTLSTQLSGVQLAITLTNLAVGFLSEPAMASLLHGPLHSAGIKSDGTADVVAVIIALILSTLLTMLFGELFPKNLAIAAPVAVAKAVQGPIRLFTRIMGAPIRLLNKGADAVLGLFGIQAQEELASARSPDELVSLVRHSAAEGTIAPRTARLMVRTLTFGDKRAVEVMTPRTQMTTVERGDSVEHFLQLIAESGYSRLAVIDSGGLDEVIGVVDLDRAVRVPYERRAGTPVAAVMSPPVQVPETLPLDDVVRALQENKAQLAIVVDEYGGTAGLLTGEDLVEELVGEVDDEFDETEPQAVRLPGGGWEVAGLLRPDEVMATTGLRLPDHGPFETIAGLVMQRLGHVPVVGDGVDVDGLRLTVSRMDRRRVDAVTLVPLPQDGGTE